VFSNLDHIENNGPGPAFSINARNLAVSTAFSMFRCSAIQVASLGETPEYVSIARDQLAFAVLEVSQSAKAIDLQFIEKFVRVAGSRRRKAGSGKSYES
jgi:hypothetical protein